MAEDFGRRHQHRGLLRQAVQYSQSRHQRIRSSGNGDTRLGPSPRHLRANTPRVPVPDWPMSESIGPSLNKEIVGVDVFVDWRGNSAEILAQTLQELDMNGFALSMITSRGVKVWPNGLAESLCTDHWRCRFMIASGQDTASHEQINGLLRNLAAADIDFIKLETLCTFNDEPGYSMGHRQ